MSAANSETTVAKTKATAEDSTAVILGQSRFVAVRPDNPMREALEANGEALGFASLTWVRTPAGGLTSWTIDDLGNETTAKTIEGALVIYRKRVILWPTDGEAIEGTRPLMVSNDGARARIVGDDPGDIDLDAIEKWRIGDSEWFDISEASGFPYSQWGSGRNGGRRVKEQRLLGILRDDDVLPLMVAIQPGSLKNITTIVSRLRVPHWRAVVSLGLQEAKNKAGQKFSQATLKVVDTLPDVVASTLKSMYTDPINSAIEGGRVQVSDEI